MVPEGNQHGSSCQLHIAVKSELELATNSVTGALGPMLSDLNWFQSGEKYQLEILIFCQQKSPHAIDGLKAFGCNHNAVPGKLLKIDGLQKQLVSER